MVFFAPLPEGDPWPFDEVRDSPRIQWNMVQSFALTKLLDPSLGKEPCGVSMEHAAEAQAAFWENRRETIK